MKWLVCFVFIVVYFSSFNFGKTEKTRILRFNKNRSKPQIIGLDDTSFSKYFSNPPREHERFVRKKNTILGGADLSTMTGIMTGTGLGTGTMTATGSDRDPSGADEESDETDFDTMLPRIPIDKPFSGFKDSRRKNRVKQKYKDNKTRGRNQIRKTHPGQNYYIRNLDYYGNDY